MSKPVLILRHVPHESAGTLENTLAKADVEFQYLDLFHEYPSSLDWEQYLGLVVMGGPMNVDEVEKYPFWADDIRWIQQAVEAGLPMLGICLGSQLLAKAFGARVYPGPIKEIGWYPLELSVAAGEDRLFAGCGPKLTVFQWHGDTSICRRAMFILPKGLIPKSGVSHRAIGLWPAIPHRDDRRDDRGLAYRIGQLRRTGYAGLYCPRAYPPKNTPRTARLADPGR